MRTEPVCLDAVKRSRAKFQEAMVTPVGFPGKAATNHTRKACRYGPNRS